MKRNIDTQILLKTLTWEDSFSLHTVSNNRKREERKSGREKEIEKGIFFFTPFGCSNKKRENKS